eukprot:Lithocolla_globosa_v1_NODE_3380_length_1686_cov_35.461680.p2 type:complete len:153 gc:universal NODE_3380_length_1686_cov_35.461680:1484-1026(-)
MMSCSILTRSALIHSLAAFSILAMVPSALMSPNLLLVSPSSRFITSGIAPIMTVKVAKMVIAKKGNNKMPSTVLGYKSPYPIVDMVTNPKYTDAPNVQPSSTAKIAEPPNQIAIKKKIQKYNRYFSCCCLGNIHNGSFLFLRSFSVVRLTNL